MLSVKKIRIINFLLFLILIFISRKIIIDNFFNETMVTVPNVINLEKDEAIKALKKSKLDASIISARSNDVPLNFVYSQTPRAGEVVKKNRAIKIYVNENRTNKIPELVGKTLTEAMRYLEENNIEIKRVDYIHTDRPDDEVLSVYPNNGKIAFGEKICLLVSTHSTISNNKMPNIVGLDVNEANRVLAQIGLKITNISRITNTTYPNNVIVSSEPNTDMPLTPNTIISVVISEQKEATENKEKEKIKQESIDNIIKKALNDKTTDNKEDKKETKDIKDTNKGSEGN